MPASGGRLELPKRRHIIRPDGTAAQPNTGLTGSASCSGEHITIQWSHGFTDQMTLSADGDQLTGTNGLIPLSGSRKSATVPPGEAAPVANGPTAPIASETPAPTSETPQKGVAKTKPATAASCQRLAGVWTALTEEIVIRPDGTAYDPSYGMTGTMTCSGQTVVIHWRRANGQDEAFTVSADGNQLNPTSFGDIQFTRTSTEIPPGQSGPPVSPTNAPINPLDLIPF